MKRPVFRSRWLEFGKHFRGYTLIEILVATTLALMLLGAVVAMFGQVGQSINDARSMLEAADRLRLAEARLQADLGGLTVAVNPPRDPANNEGYLEIIKGPVGTTPLSPGAPGAPSSLPATQAMAAASQVAANTDNGNVPDTAVGDFADILMFTTRSSGRPFVGLCASTPSGTIQSEVAEVAWFIRGRNLHRRQLLVVPSQGPWASAVGFYQANDISARVNAATGQLVASTLGDLTRRECRFAHVGAPPTWHQYPYDVRNWSWTVANLPRGVSLPAGVPVFCTLPTLSECTSPGWSTESTPSVSGTTPLQYLDFWTNKPNTPTASYRLSEYAFSAAPGTRTTDDIILTNVIGFDVKAWDPNYVDPATSLKGAYVDLGYNNVTGNTTNTELNSLQHLGTSKSNLVATQTTSRVYDTYSTHYEIPPASAHTPWAWDGFDNNNNGVVDAYSPQPNASSVSQNNYCPPYPMPLRGIQVKIRIFEPDSKLPREVTVEQTFLPQ